MQLKKILVTGGAGFIGTHVSNFFAVGGYEVVVLDSLHPQIHPSGAVSKDLSPKINFIKGDVTSRADWQRALEGIDGVIHFAAAVGVGQSMYQVERYVKDNSLGTAILLDILANEKHSVKKIIVASSMTTYGEGFYRCPTCSLEQQPSLRLAANMQKGIWEPLCKKCTTQLVAIATPETARQDTPSIYGITKKNQEELVLSIGRAYGIPAVSLRFFNAFGPGQSLSNPYCGVAAIFLSRVKNGQTPLITEDGKQTRDFIYISDIVNVVHEALTNDAANYEVFNVGSGIPTTVTKVAETAIKLYSSNLTPQISGKFRTFDIRHCFADVTKLKTKLHWEPQVSFDAGMQKVFEWSKENESVDHVDEAFAQLSKRGLI